MSSLVIPPSYVVLQSWVAPQSWVIRPVPVVPVIQTVLVSVAIAALFARATFLPVRAVRLVYAPALFDLTNFSGAEVALEIAIPRVIAPGPRTRKW